MVVVIDVILGNNTDVDYLGDVGRYMNVNTVAVSASASKGAKFVDRYHRQLKQIRGSVILSLI